MVSHLLARIDANFHKHIVSSALYSSVAELFVNYIPGLHFIPGTKETVSLKSYNVFQVEQAVKSRGCELLIKGSVYRLAFSNGGYKIVAKGSGYELH